MLCKQLNQDWVKRFVTDKWRQMTVSNLLNPINAVAAIRRQRLMVTAFRPQYIIFAFPAISFGTSGTSTPDSNLFKGSASPLPSLLSQSGTASCDISNYFEDKITAENKNWCSSSRTKELKTLQTSNARNCDRKTSDCVTMACDWWNDLEEPISKISCEEYGHNLNFEFRWNVECFIWPFSWNVVYRWPLTDSQISNGWSRLSSLSLFCGEIHEMAASNDNSDQH